MTLEEFNYIAEIIASLAVIASLIYLAVQVKQGTQAVRLNTVHNVTEEFRDWNNVLATNGASPLFYSRGCNRHVKSREPTRYVTTASCTHCSRPLRMLTFNRKPGRWIQMSGMVSGNQLLT